MTTSDIIALFALVVSLVSFWLSYRSTYLSKIVAAAEKRAQAYISLVEALLHAQEQKSILSKLRGHPLSKLSLTTGDEKISNKLGGIFRSLDEREKELHQILLLIEERLACLRSEKNNDLVSLEEYSSFTNELNLRMKHNATIISSLDIQIKDVYDELKNAVNT